MPNRCVAAGCENMPSDSVSLFRFPKEPHLCGLWTRQVQRTRANWKPTAASVLCSEHFSVDCFDDIPSLKASLGCRQINPDSSNIYFYILVVSRFYGSLYELLSSPIF